jgi:putative methionine-R-sulfoxide reductase with GAF domain
MSRYTDLLKEIEGFARSARGTDSLMEFIARRLHEVIARYNWVGFYLMEDSVPKALLLGPYVGSFAPYTRIPLDKGLCGAAATSAKTVVVNAAQNDPRYIGSEMVKSTIVVPILIKNPRGRRTGYRKLFRRHVHQDRPGICRVLRRAGGAIYGAALSIQPSALS